MANEKKVDVLAQETAYPGYLRIDRYQLRHSLYRGGMSADLHREVLQRGHAVAVLPYDPVRDQVVLIEQFRIGPFARGDSAWCLEIIAGIIEAGEDISAVAHREAREEAGIELQELLPVLTYYTSPGALTETIAVYCGRVDGRTAGGIHGLADEGEDIRVIVISFDEAMAALSAGRIVASHAVIGLQWLALNRDALRAKWDTAI